VSIKTFDLKTNNMHQRVCTGVSRHARSPLEMHRPWGRFRNPFHPSSTNKQPSLCSLPVRVARTLHIVWQDHNCAFISAVKSAEGNHHTLAPPPPLSGRFVSCHLEWPETFGGCCRFSRRLFCDFFTTNGRGSAEECLGDHVNPTPGAQVFDNKGGTTYISGGERVCDFNQSAHGAAVPAKNQKKLQERYPYWSSY